MNRIFEEGQERRINQTLLRQLLRIAKEIEKRSLLFRDFSISNHLVGFEVDQEFLDDEVASQIADNWLYYDGLARSLVESKGAKFVHILQPNWLTFKNGSDAVKLKGKDMKLIQTTFEKYATPETKIKNLTKIFDDLSETPFLDWAHVDEIGSAKVAEEMFVVLEPLLKEQSK